MDQNKNGNSTPVSGPHGFGGGAVHQATNTGNRKQGHEDYEDSTKDEEIRDEDLSNWVFEIHTDLHDHIVQLVTLADKMYSFSSTTKNLHKEMKTWCTELKGKMMQALEKSETLKPYVDKAGDRIMDLSSSLLEASIRAIPPIVGTMNKATNTEPETPVLVPSDSSTARNYINGQKKAHQSNQQVERVPFREENKKKAKMKRECISRVQVSTEGTGQVLRHRTQKLYKKTNNEVVVVRPSGAITYAEVAKKLKTSINVNTLNVNIKGMKKAKSGDLIIQIDKGPKQEEAAARLKDAVIQTLGADAVVKHSPKTEIIEVRDLEAETTIEEITQAVVNTTSTTPDSVKVIRMLPSYGGNKMAVIKMKYKDAHTLQKLGRLIVGLVRCRVKLKTQIARCYRCHNFGHYRASCRGTDRTGQCMTCGQENHEAKDCKSPARCVLCEESGYESNHYPGSQACREYKEAKKLT